MNDLDLKKFNRIAIRSKKELLVAIDDYPMRLNHCGEFGSVRESRKDAVVELMKEFRVKLESSPIPTLEQPFFCYEITITDVEISLSMLEYNEIKFDKEGSIEEATSSETPDIVHVRVPFIAIDEFASQRGVKTATVRQWIRRGKLRNAERRGSNWFVASTEGKPERGFSSGTYYCDSDEGDLSDHFPLPKGSRSIYLQQDGSSCAECVASVYGADGNLIDKLQLNQSNREKLEHALIAASDVVFESTFIDGIIEKVASAEETEELIYDKNDKIAQCFLDQASLSQDAKCLLAVIGSSADAEGLCSKAIKTLGLEDEFLKFSF